MYAGRGKIQEMTGENLNDKYFTQTLLPDYLNNYPEKTKTWDVVFDARGHLQEPHTGKEVPLGTMDVRKYLGDIRLPQGDGVEFTPRGLFPTSGPKNRFQAVLFIEKEGFLPLFKKTKLAERFDVAIMSTKGMSTTAARLLVDRLCGRNGIPLLTLHDFDKSGFSILGMFGRNNRRYTFKNEIQVIDFGLRLEDVEDNHLESEEVAANDNWEDNLRENGATPEEIEFLCAGQRVELNAFTSADLVAWLEKKLKKHKIEKVVPDDLVLEQAFRGAVEADYIQNHFDKISEEARVRAQKVSIPSDLASQVRRQLKKKPALPWDEVIKDLAENLDLDEAE
jgi:hypothetical protein